MVIYPTSALFTHWRKALSWTSLLSVHDLSTRGRRENSLIYVDLLYEHHNPRQRLDLPDKLGLLNCIPQIENWGTSSHRIHEGQSKHKFKMHAVHWIKSWRSTKVKVQGHTMMQLIPMQCWRKQKTSKVNFIFYTWYCFTDGQVFFKVHQAKP
jgi:hypothetical protein